MSEKKANNSYPAHSAQFGGLDIIQFVVALLIIGIAAASSTFSIFIGRGALDYEWRKKRALELARNEVEYWTAMIYEGQIEERNQSRPLPVRLVNKPIEREEILDQRSLNTGDDDIWCKIIREPLDLNNILLNQQSLLSYRIEVSVVWHEPSENQNYNIPADTVKLWSWMIYKESL